MIAKITIFAKICGDPVCGCPDYPGPSRAMLRPLPLGWICFYDYSIRSANLTAELEAFDEFVDRQLRQGIACRHVALCAFLARKRHTAAVGAVGGELPVEARPRAEVHLAAISVEMIHVASLIHDDVIDESDTRRAARRPMPAGSRTKAVILGDFILARNMNIGLSSEQFDLVTHVCGSMAALREGEVLQSGAEAHTMTRARRTSTLFIRRPHA